MCSREDDGYFFALDSPLTLEEICGSDDPAADSPPPCDRSSSLLLKAESPAWNRPWLPEALYEFLITYYCFPSKTADLQLPRPSVSSILLALRLESDEMSDNIHRVPKITPQELLFMALLRYLDDIYDRHRNQIREMRYSSKKETKN